MHISASVYAFPNVSLEATVGRLDAFGVDYLHVDCNDDPGVFEDIARIRTVSHTPIDLHLITPTPQAYYEGIRTSGVQLCAIQYESANGPLDVPDDLGARMGLAIQPGTPVDVFDPYAERFAFIMVMTTVPGRSGAVFDNAAFAQIRQARRRFPAKAIHVDGGVDGEVSYILRNLDVQLAVSGSFLRKAPSVGAGLTSLKGAAASAGHRVRDFMAWPAELPIVREDELDLRRVLATIDRGRVGYCLVVDDADRLCAVVSDGDIRRAMLRQLEAPLAARPSPTDGDWMLPLDGLINRSPVTIAEDATIAEMLELLEAHPRPIPFLPVTDAEHRLRGAISFAQLLRNAS